MLKKRKNNCESSLEWHIKQALDSGASREEIIEALEVGIDLGGGPASRHEKKGNISGYIQKTITILCPENQMYSMFSFNWME